MMRYSIHFLLCTIMTLSGCTQNYLASANSTHLKGRLVTSVFLTPTCKATKESFAAILIPIAVALGKETIKAGISYIQSQVEKVKEEHNASYSAVFSGDFFKVAKKTKEQILLAPNYRCITIVRGNFGDMGEGDTGEGDWTKVRLEQFGLRTRPAFIFEGMIELSGTQKHFKVTPVYLEINEVAAKRGREKKNLTVQLTFIKAAGSVEAGLQNPLGSSPLQYAELEIPSKMKKNEMPRSDTLWMAVPPVGLDKEQIRHLRTNNTLAPFSLIVTVKEESEPSDLWNVTSSAIKGASPKVQDVLIGVVERLGESGDETNSKNK